ncbi:MAG: glycolate oxidase subunit GlcF [Thiohalophilus sp.]|uniref:glycolate oxidase subunit GlcF n=1 Tax=Thiohalophilus sp. TaxID=3028392 RepID=UPI0028701A0F|nr:glycolate oxidase subunit GlcF [Thiohalophilus sp.]MDR9436718.1 glycolate oxidase subunit GlcF [Thiohalophilus sp.]
MKVELAEAYQNTELGQEAESLLMPCVQCGQCTFTCPTFRLTNDEWDGPRGRIYLIKQFLEGKEPGLDLLPPAYTLKTLEGRTLGQNLQLHLDRCLTCRSCETSCPQDVHYGRLLDIGRELVEKQVSRPFKERFMRQMLRTVVAHRRGFSTFLKLGQLFRRILPDELRSMVPVRRKAGVWPGQDRPRKMLIWQGCVQPDLAPDINAAAARVLDRFGIELIPTAEGCCGALSQHMAETEEARDFMRKNIDAIWPYIEQGAEAIVLTASGCGMQFREYGELLKDDPQYGEKARRISALTRDIAEIVGEEWSRQSSTSPSDQSNTNKTRRRIAFQSSCSLQHGEKLNGVTEKLLKQAGFKLVPVAYPFMCCGAAGTYSILQRAFSKSLRAMKLESLLASRPETIATANIGCLTHLSAVSPVPVRHWIELLDEKLENN